MDTLGNSYVSQRLAPALRFKLNNPNDNFWESIFFENEGNQVLTNEPNFKEFFRGLYIKSEGISDGSVMLLNFASSNSKLTIHYTSDNTNVDDSDTGSTDKSIELIKTMFASYILSGQLIMTSFEAHGYQASIRYGADDNGKMGWCAQFRDVLSGP